MTHDLYTITTANAPTVYVETTIDGWLTDDEIEILYKRWKNSWPEMVEHPGDVWAITCERVKQVPQAQLNRTYGKVRGQKFMRIAEENAND